MNLDVIAAAFAPIVLTIGAMALALWKDIRKENQNHESD